MIESMYRVEIPPVKREGTQTNPNPGISGRVIETYSGTFVGWYFQGKSTWLETLMNTPRLAEENRHRVWEGMGEMQVAQEVWNLYFKSLTSTEKWKLRAWSWRNVIVPVFISVLTSVLTYTLTGI